MHAGYPGTIVRIKVLARAIVWWPQIDQDIEKAVQGCTPFQEHQKRPPQTPLQPWRCSDRPWIPVHADYICWPIYGKEVFIVIDAHSRGPVVQSATSQTTVECLRSMFATYGLPEQLVADNGSVSTNQEFDETNDINFSSIIQKTANQRPFSTLYDVQFMAIPHA